MGELFRICCEHCDTNPEVSFEGFAGAVLTHRDLPGEVVSQGYLAYLSPEDELIVLPHPTESYRLAAAGGSWNRSSLEGRLLDFTNLICVDCGTRNKTAQVHSAGPGCTVGLIAGMVTLVVSLWLLQLPSWLAFSLSWFSAIIPPWIVGWIVERIHHDKAEPYRFQKCIQCGGPNAVPLSAGGKEKYPCPRCGERSVTIRYAGKS